MPDEKITQDEQDVEAQRAYGVEERAHEPQRPRGNELADDDDAIEAQRMWDVQRPRDAQRPR